MFNGHSGGNEKLAKRLANKHLWWLWGFYGRTTDRQELLGVGLVSFSLALV